MRDARVQSMILPSDPHRLRDARRWLESYSVDAGLTTPEAHDLAVAFSEVCANVHRHAYAGRADGRVELAVCLQDDTIVVTVEHQGERFDPRAYTPPDLGRPAESGYGLYLISRLVDDVSFENTVEGGRIVLVKRRRPAGARSSA